MQDETQTTIYKLNIERNTKPISLKNYRQFDYNPICSPNGDKIAFESSDGGPQADICLMDIDGSNKVSITLTPYHDHSPIFSPDSSRIFFIRAKAFTNYSPMARPGWHNSDVYSINLDGSGLKRITSGNYYSLNDLSIDPKGKKLLAYLMGKEECCTIFEIPLKDPENTKPIKPIVNPKEFKITLSNPFPRRSFEYDKLRGPKYNPTTGDILFMPNFDEIYIMKYNSNLSKEILHLDEREHSSIYDPPSFSFDGKKIVYAERKAIGFSGGLYTIWISDADGKNKKLVYYPHF